MLDTKNEHLVSRYSFDQLISKIKPQTIPTKTYKIDPDRLLYS